MKKYIKPIIEIISFDVNSFVMAPSPDPFAGTYSTQNIVSEPLNDYIPQDIDRKVWSTLDDGENWNWQD